MFTYFMNISSIDFALPEGQKASPTPKKLRQLPRHHHAQHTVLRTIYSCFTPKSFANSFLAITVLLLYPAQRGQRAHQASNKERRKNDDAAQAQGGQGGGRR